jgi:hypothetical protein
VLPDGTPDAFAFASLTGQPGDTVVAAAPVRLTGFNTPIAVSADGGAEVTTDGGTRAVVVTAGGVSTTWAVGVVDQIPDAFAFLDRMGEDANEMAVSEPVVPTGYNAPTPISVAGASAPAISVGGSPFTPATVIALEQSVVVRLATTPTSFTTRTATVTIGGVSVAWTVATGGIDTTPDPFAIAALTNQTPNAIAVSAQVLLTGFDASLTLSASGDGGPQVSVDDGATWASSRRLRPGQAFRVRLTAGAGGTTATTVVDAGGVAAAWTVTTRLSGTAPNAFAIAALANQPGNTVVERAFVAPEGYTDPTTISVSGAGAPEVSVANGPWTTAATIAPGQSFRVRMTSPAPDGLTRTATVAVGGVSAGRSVTTINMKPNPMGPFSVTGQTPGACMQSDEVVFTGMTHPAVFTDAVQVSGAGGVANGFSWILVGTGVRHGVGHVVQPGQPYREGSPQVSVGGDAWTTDASTGPGQSFRVRLTSAPVADGVVRTATVLIGVPGAPGQSVVAGDFVVTVADRMPDAFSFAPCRTSSPGPWWSRRRRRSSAWACRRLPSRWPAVRRRSTGAAMSRAASSPMDRPCACA